MAVGGGETYGVRYNSPVQFQGELQHKESQQKKIFINFVALSKLYCDIGGNYMVTALHARANCRPHLMQ
jgi:hypothetical protein